MQLTTAVMKKRLLCSTTLAVLALIAAPGAAPAIELIQYCGQSFRNRGILVTDLDCSDFIGPGVVIERGRLFLDGHTISGAGYFGVQCLTSCQIIGPGTITRSGMDGVHVGKWVILKDVRVTNNGINGVIARNNSLRGRVILKDSIVAGNTIHGVETDVAVVMSDSMVFNNGEHGLDVGLRDCNSAGRIVMYRSAVVDNGLSCQFNDVCADLTSCSVGNSPPRLLRGSMCGTSYVRESGFPGMSWGVCNGG